ncbi:hypothetical protein [Sphingomonas sp. MMS24-J13]|uniref:hypothetical protein n=1 Tax=Sphingomonas sp. MMS24-J13 TaxID=3238686 RepID=UPI00384B8CBC
MSRHFLLAAPLLLGLAGCAALPGTGPSASSMRKAPDVQVVDITPDVASAAREVALAQGKASLDHALAALRAAPAEPGFQIAPGDVLDVAIWSFSPGRAPEAPCRSPIRVRSRSAPSRSAPMVRCNCRTRAASIWRG